MVTAGWDRALGLTAGFLLDRVFGDPVRYHPVAGMGTAAGKLERILYRDSRWTGTVFTVTCVGSVTGAGVMGRRAGVLPTALITWAALGGTSLTSVGERLADSLAADDIDGARNLIPSLCGRDPNSLDRDGMARAALESVAENTSDATVGPLVWGAIFGIPGLLAYRMINTLDAMVGYRNVRYSNFGWASARLDDVANFVPARLTALLVAALGDDRAGAITAVRRDASAHPSPNAGVVEASFAGALGVQLGGVTVYRHRTETRPTLGDGRSPTGRDLYRAAALSRRVQIGALAAVTVGQLVVRRGRRS